MKKHLALLLSFLLGSFFLLLVATFSFSSDPVSQAQPPLVKGVPHFKKHAKMDRIELAIAQEVALTQDPATGTVPRERLFDVHQFIERQSETTTRAAISGITWDERGPNNVAGRTRSLLVDQTDPTGNTVWAASVGGGLWKTSNISANPPTWVNVSDTFLNIAGTAIVQDPSNFNTLYYGTGEGWFNADAIRGLGIWKSTNGGANWTLLNSTANNTFFYIQKMVVDATGNVYACTRSGGLQKSTDGGASWSKVLGSGVSASVDRAADIEIAANGDLFVAMGIFQQDGIYKSTNGGSTWTKLSNGLPASNYHRIELACAPSDANRVYALFQDATDYDCLGIYRTDNGGTNWVAVSNPSAFGMTSFTRNQAWYDLIAMVSPANPDRLFIGGIDILVSDNAGASFSQITQWYGGNGLQYAHADQHAFVFQAGNSNLAYFANDGGLFRSANANDPNLSNISMTERNTGYNVTQYYACAIHPQAGNPYFLAGSQDNGTQRYNGPGINATTTVTGGDGAFCHIDEDQPEIQITSYVYNAYFVSNNGFTSYSSVTFTDGGGDDIGSFINPTDYDSRSNTLYACANAGEYLRWSDVTNNTTEAIIGVAAFGGAQITHVKVSPNVENRVYFGLSNGRVVRVDNAHSTPTAVHLNAASSMPFGSISCIAIAEDNEDHLLVTYSNYGISSVWQSLDGGSTWVDKNDGLPDMPVRWALIDPCDPNQALLATEMGVWSTDNLSANFVVWGLNDSNLPRVRTDMLKLRKSDGKLIVATHGRGLYSTDFYVKPSVEYSNTASFVAEEALSGTEGNCRGYTDINLSIEISTAPTSDVLIELIPNSSSSTATQGEDYQIMTPMPLTFPLGATADQVVTIRVYEDGQLEGTEVVNFELNRLNNCDVYLGTQKSYELSIIDGEINPIGIGSYTTNILNENFDAGVQPAGWSTSTLGFGPGFGFGDAASLSASYWPITDNGTNIAGMNDFGNPNSSNDRLNAPIIDLSNATYARIYFDAFFGGYSFNGFTENAFLEISTNGGATWDQYSIPGNGATWTNYFLDLTAYLNESAVSIAFRYNDNGGYLYGLALDNVLVEASFPNLPATVESQLNKEDTHELGPGETLYFYDTDDEVIAILANNSPYDFGCVTAKVDRAGANTVNFWSDTDVSRDLAAKTLLVTPETNHPNASISITMFYSANEVMGWETATGKSWGTDAKIVKSPGAIGNISPSNPYPDGTNIEQAVSVAGNLGSGTDYFISATFNTGLSGFGLGDPGPPPTFPITLLDFDAELEADGRVRLDWSTAQEKDNQAFEVQRSIDGEEYSTIATLAGQGNSSTTVHYQSWDENPFLGPNLYRLRQIDFDGASTLSKVVEVSLIPNVLDQSLSAFPTQFADFVDLYSTNPFKGPLKTEWLSLDGKLLDRQTWSTSSNQQSLRLYTHNLNMPSGIYLLRVTTASGDRKTFKLEKRP